MRVSFQYLSKARKDARAEQGYEGNPPRCFNCRHCVRPDRSQVYESEQCALGGFRVRSFSICDKWTSKKGEGLAP